MGRIVQDTIRKIETFLYRRGFRSPASRRLLAVQLLVTGASLLTGFAALHTTVLPMAFAVGCVLIACNTWWLTRSVEWSLARRYSASLALAAAFSFVFRLGAMALGVYIALVWLALPALPLLAGLSTVVLNLFWQECTRIRQTMKEA